MTTHKKAAGEGDPQAAMKIFSDYYFNTYSDSTGRIEFAIIQNCHDTQIKAYSLEWQSLIERLQKSLIRESKDGAAILFAIFTKPYRKAENVQSITAICLDIEINKADGSHPPTPAKAAENLRHKGIEAALYTTHSHAPEAPRYRVIIPLDRPIAPNGIKLVFAVVEDVLPELAHWFDAKCKEAARLFYLPAVPAASAFNYEFHHVSGEITKADTIEFLVASKRAALEARKEQRTQWRGEDRSSYYTCAGSIIERFNKAFRLEEILLAHGYTKKGKRWLSPESSSGIAGVHVFSDGRMYSHHADMLGAGGLIDAFQAYCQLEHGGNKSAAAKAASKLLEATI